MIISFSWLKFAVLLSIIVLAYLSRCVFEFVSVGTGTFYQIHSGDNTNDVVVFVLLFVWELIPLTAVLLLFGSVGGGGGGSVGGSGASGITSGGASGVAPIIVSINTDSRASVLPGMASASSEGDPILGRGSKFFKKDTRYDSDSDDDMSAPIKYESSVGASPYRAFPTSSGSFGSLGKSRLYQQQQQQQHGASSSSFGDK